MNGVINVGKNKGRFCSKILRLKDYLSGVSIARQQINYLKPRFVEECDGDILEIGGIDNFFKVNYKKGKFVNYDIVPSAVIDIVGDAENMVDVPDESFSAVICISVIEHTLNHEKMLNEINRVLKKNGRFYISVPWMYQLHMEPKDYLRFSDCYMLKLFEKTGFVVDAKFASNSFCGTAAHFLQGNVSLRYTFGLLFATIELFSVSSFIHCTQVNYYLSKKD